MAADCPLLPEGIEAARHKPDGLFCALFRDPAAACSARSRVSGRISAIRTFGLLSGALLRKGIASAPACASLGTPAVQAQAASSAPGKAKTREPCCAPGRRRSVLCLLEDHATLPGMAWPLWTAGSPTGLFHAGLGRDLYVEPSALNPLLRCPWRGGNTCSHPEHRS